MPRLCLDEELLLETDELLYLPQLLDYAGRLCRRPRLRHMFVSTSCSVKC